MAGLGGIFIVAKTKVAVMEYGLDNNWHMSGYTLSAKTGLKLDYRNRWFALAALRGGYSSLHDVLVYNDAPERADHNLSYLEGFDEMESIIKELNFPVSPESIFVSNSHHKSVLTRYCAENAEHGCKIIHGQYGGSYGQWDMHWLEKYYKSISLFGVQI